MSDDTISRQETIDAIEQHKMAVLEGLEIDEGIAYGYEAAHRHLVDIVKQLPSAERLGTWTTKRTMYHDGETYCDQCGWTWEDITHGRISVTRTPFCPNCGARMRMTRE